MSFCARVRVRTRCTPIVRASPEKIFYIIIILKCVSLSVSRSVSLAVSLTRLKRPANRCFAVSLAVSLAVLLAVPLAVSRRWLPSQRGALAVSAGWPSAAVASAARLVRAVSAARPWGRLGGSEARCLVAAGGCAARCWGWRLWGLRRPLWAWALGGACFGSCCCARGGLAPRRRGRRLHSGRARSGALAGTALGYRRPFGVRAQPAIVPPLCACPPAPPPPPPCVQPLRARTWSRPPHSPKALKPKAAFRAPTAATPSNSAAQPPAATRQRAA